MHVKDVVSLADLTTEEIYEILETARNLKLEHRAGVKHEMLAGKTLALIFQKPSLRTRVSFETGMTQLGGTRSTSGRTTSSSDSERRPRTSR